MLQPFDFLGGDFVVLTSSSGLSSEEELLLGEEGRELEGFCAAPTNAFCCVVFKTGLEVFTGTGVAEVNDSECLFVDNLETGCDSTGLLDLTGFRVLFLF